MKKVAIIFAAGQGQRFLPLPAGTKHKSLLILKNKTLIEHTIEYLLTDQTIAKIVIVVGAKKTTFNFLATKYSQVVLVTNACFAKHRTGCALLRVKKYFVNADTVFLIAGDIVCYYNYFASLTHRNLMAASPRSKTVSAPTQLYYQIDAQKTIVGITNQPESLYLVGEFSVLTKNWIQAIEQSFAQHQKHLPSQEIYQILINTAQKAGIKPQLHLLRLPGPADIDTFKDWEKVQQVF